MPIVSYNKNKYEIDNEEVIYFGLDKQGVPLPHGCLSGSCGACAMIIADGDQNLSAPGVIETDTIEALNNDATQSEKINNRIIRLTCRAKVLGDISIEDF